MFKFLNKRVPKPIFFAVILISIIVVGVVVFQKYSEIKRDKKETLEIKIPEKKENLVEEGTTTEEVQKAKEVSPVTETRIVKASFEGTAKDKIIFTDSNGGVISEVNLDSIKSSGLDGDYILVHPEAVETLDGYFYFFIANSDVCGSNCSWLIFKFDTNNQQLSYFGKAKQEGEGDADIFEGDADIFGSIGDYSFSPDKKKVAVNSLANAGACRFSADIDVINLEKNKLQNIGNKYINKEHSIHEIKSLNWTGNDCLTFTSLESDCEGGKYVSKESKEIKYCVSTNKTEILKK